MHRFRQWLMTHKIHDPIQQRQAPLLQIFFLVLLAATAGGVAMLLVVPMPWELKLPVIMRLTIASIMTAVAITLFRQGWFYLSVWLITLVQIMNLGSMVVLSGVEQNGAVLFTFALPLTVASLLLGRRGAWTVGAICLLSLLGAVWARQLVPELASTRPQEGPMMTILMVAIAGSAIVVLLSSFASNLRQALLHAIEREKQLAHLHSSLEEQVATRTAALQHALATVEQREGELQSTVADLAASRTIIRDLSAPIIPVLPGVLVAPLIGEITDERAQDMMANMLETVQQQSTRLVIVDITGVPTVNTAVATILIQTAAALKLLGARVQLVGIRPDVAQTLTSLDVDLRQFTTLPTLQAAIETLLAERNVHTTTARSVVGAAA